MKKSRLFIVILILSFTVIVISKTYIAPENMKSYYLIVIYSGENLTNMTFILPAMIDPVTNEMLDISSSNTNNVINRTEIETPYGKMLMVYFNESSLVKLGPENFDTLALPALLAEKPWAKKSGEAIVVDSLPNWKASLNPKINVKTREIKLRYGFGFVELPFQEKKDFGNLTNEKIFERPNERAFERFDTYGMAAFEGSGTLAVTIYADGCRIKKFFFLPIPPDARDSICYRLTGEFTTNKSGEFVPFQITGYATRLVSP